MDTHLTESRAVLSSRPASPRRSRQTNITEKGPVRYDIGWWREQWKRTETQAVIVNAGGSVAYDPSRFPLHHQAEFLGGRDLRRCRPTAPCAAKREEAAAAIARAIENPSGEEYTNPVLQGMAVQYIQDVDAFERRASGS